MNAPQSCRPTTLRLRFLPASLLLLTLTALHAEGTIIISGDFVSGPTGSPPTSTDPAFWTNGGDPNSDPNVLPNTDGIIGVTSDGMLTISAGSGLNLFHLDLGQQPGATGTVEVTGAGSTLNLGRHFHIGAHADEASTLDGGNGMLSITNGGVVEVVSDIWLGDSGASTGTALVDGAGSILRTGDDIFVGDDGMGSLTITNGGLVEVTDLTSLGEDPGGNGIVLIDGNGSILRTRDIDVGDDSPGQLTIQNGGFLDVADDIRIGEDPGGSGSVATVQGAGSVVTVDDQFSIAREGNGTLNVLNGGRAEAPDFFIATEEDVVGTANVSGTGSIMRSDVNFLVGFFGKGILNVEDGGRAEAGGTIFIGLEPTGNGHVTVKGVGTTLAAPTGGIEIGPQGGDGSILVLDGAQVTALGIVNLAVDASSDAWVEVRGADSSITADSLLVGDAGSAKFNISESGSANFDTAGVTSGNTVNLVVSSNNMLSATTSYTNDGVTNFIAGSQLASGSYTPIDSPSYAGSGSYVGIGGTTNFPSGVPTFTVGAIITDTGDGTENMINGGDRVRFGDVTISLDENAGTDGSLTVTDLNLLTILGDEALSAFSFEASGLISGLLNALSFDVGQQNRDALRVFRRMSGAGDSAWVAFEPAITDYTNGTFTFTVNELGGFDYAVAIPEPISLALLGLGGLLVAPRRRGSVKSTNRPSKD